MALTKTGMLARTAFCAICPAPEAVTAFLLGLGLRLTFQLGAVHYAAYLQLPDLPAQYHYQAKGGEVMYLAGEDTPLDGECLPRHASRFWAYPGADADAFQQIIATLAAKWSLTWQPLGHALSLGGKHAASSVLSCFKERSA